METTCFIVSWINSCWTPEVSHLLMKEEIIDTILNQWYQKNTSVISFTETTQNILKECSEQSICSSLHYHQMSNVAWNSDLHSEPMTVEFVEDYQSYTIWYENILTDLQATEVISPVANKSEKLPRLMFEPPIIHHGVGSPLPRVWYRMSLGKPLYIWSGHHLRVAGVTAREADSLKI